MDGAVPISHDVEELLINRAWRPSLAVTGAEGFPTLLQGGNVLRPYTSLKISVRLPPTLDAGVAGKRLKGKILSYAPMLRSLIVYTEILEKDPPYGAKVTYTIEKEGTGWESPALKHWLEKAVEDASVAFFQKKHVRIHLYFITHTSAFDTK